MDRDEAIRLLRGGERGVKKWNALGLPRGEADKLLQHAQLSEIDLAGIDLVGVYLDGVNFARTNLRNAALQSATMYSCNLEETHIAGADLNNARFLCMHFERTNLRRSQLQLARFSNCTLSGVELNDADMSTARFFDVHLRDCDFTCARLRGAQPINASFHDVKLCRADLREAVLRGASLTRVDCADADLTSTVFGRTSICSDLTSASHLEDALHDGPSQMSLDLIRAPKRPWPVAFLRGCGLSDLEIETLSALSTSPIQYYSAFISYSTKDDAFAIKLHDALQARGIRCWLDKHAVLPGDNIYRAVNEGIRLWDKVLLCCSKDSLSSWWVKDEVARALEKEQRLEKERGKETLSVIPLDLDGQLFADDGGFEHGATLRKRHAASFKGWLSDEKQFDAQVERVVKALRADESARAKPPPPKL